PSLPEDAGDKRDIFHINEQTPGMLLKSLRKTGLDHHVWLKDQMIRQADWWLETKVRGEEAQTKIYQKIQKPFWRGLWKLVAVLPTRLFFVTDLFAVAWKDKKPTVVNKLPNAWSERYSALFTRL
ncbi:MAG: hypothetical protein IH612_05725, partial [Desulfofustis sp.]|nr:hypothetical protein [Desulfofustis sp.]